MNVEISGYDSPGRLDVDTITRDGNVWNGSGNSSSTSPPESSASTSWATLPGEYLLALIFFRH